MTLMNEYRRAVLAGLLATATAVAVGLRWRAERQLEYRDLPGLEPFRELVSSGSLSAASVALAGLADDRAGRPTDLAGRVTRVRSDLCRALFGPSTEGGNVPAAYFSDFNCPNCRVLERELASVVESDGLQLVWHELPILGAASVSAAQAVLAAERQGQREAMRARLLRAGLVTDEPYIRAVAEDLGLDPDLLMKDMESLEVHDMLLTSRALAEVFGFIGTPALVVGRTVIIGSVPAGTIRQVVEDEQEFQGPVCGTG